MKLWQLRFLSTMRLFRKAAKADQSSLQNDTYTYNVTTAPAHTLPGRDSVRPPDETESPITNTLGVAETSEVPTPNYSKRPSQAG